MKVSISIGNIILGWYFFAELQIVEEFLFQFYNKSGMLIRMVIGSARMDKRTWSHS
jgi:hypothetical protein